MNQPRSALATPRPALEVMIAPGPLLLSTVGRGPELAVHEAQWGPLPALSAQALVELTAAAELRGRGGAGFPFARKLTTVLANRRLGRAPVIVVNAAEGEPASAKDTALILTAPHLVLDGAVLAARALGAREIHVMTPTERPGSGTAVTAALAERRQRGGERVTWRHHEVGARFVSGQAQAVLEHIAGRVGLPVTAWVPEAVRGVRGRPTLLSNAETYAQVAALCHVGLSEYAAVGQDSSLGTTLLTVNRMTDDRLIEPYPLVVEVPTGAPLSTVLDAEDLRSPVLLGGFHGTWARPEQLAGARVSRPDVEARGLALGAGVVAPYAGSCPEGVTAAIVDYLAGESAGRCGPCVNGLPALARAMTGLVADPGRSGPARGEVERFCGLVAGRGACTHPDGVVRLVRSLLTLMDPPEGWDEP